MSSSRALQCGGLVGILFLLIFVGAFNWNGARPARSIYPDSQCQIDGLDGYFRVSRSSSGFSVTSAGMDILSRDAQICIFDRAMAKGEEIEINAEMKASVPMECYLEVTQLQEDDSTSLGTIMETGGVIDSFQVGSKFSKTLSIASNVVPKSGQKRFRLLVMIRGAIGASVSDLVVTAKYVAKDVRRASQKE